VVETAAIKRFVVDVLGCGCPDEVFAAIAIERDRPAVAQVVTDWRIDVGHRLLIYIVDGRQLIQPARQLAALVETGRTERDRQQFNRFRLVVVAGDGSASERTLRPLFEKLVAVDERTHLHVVTPEQVAALATA
jgi:hypothetical protein